MDSKRNTRVGTGVVSKALMKVKQDALRYAQGLNKGSARCHDDEDLNEGELIYLSLLQGKAKCLTSLEYFNNSLIYHYYRGRRMQKLWGR